MKLKIGMGVSLALLVGISGFAAERCDGLVIRQVAPPTVTAGASLATTIKIHHSGDCEIQGLEITDYLPQDAQWLRASPEPEEFPGKSDGRDRAGQPLPVNRVKWISKEFSPGSTLELEVSVLAPVKRSGWVRNTVCIAAPGMVRKCDAIETFVRQE